MGVLLPRAMQGLLLSVLAFTAAASAQSLEAELQAIPARQLAAQAKSEGDAARGAVVFFQQQMSCAKCHTLGKGADKLLGPDLTALGKEVTDETLVEAVLLPSKTIRKGFEAVTVITTDGKTLSALLVEHTEKQLVVRDVARGGEVTTFAADAIEEVRPSAVSIMPAGQVNQLNSRQQFLDLVRYLIEIRDGGAARALELQPPQSLLTFTVPEYESHLDHAGLVKTWDAAALKRGEATYQRVCANCHGTKDQPGSLPTSLRFAEGKFKNGSDPLSMYRTLTHGFGLMAPQTWMVPSQKYDVIHYIRETYLKPHNPSQFVPIDEALLARLPKGDTRGPAPSTIVAWSAMDYGPSLTHTYEVPGEAHNIAYKGIAVRLDPGAGGISRGRHWLVFDTDTLRAAVAWNGSGNTEDNFIDWQGIQFNGAHGVHPRVVGKTSFVNATGPGWGDPHSGAFIDNQRVLGRDGKRYGPLPRDWGQYRGHYHHGQEMVFSYTVGKTAILEMPALLPAESQSSPSLFLRTFNIGPRDSDLVLQVAEHPAADAQLKALTRADRSVAIVAPPDDPEQADQPFAFDGNSYLEVPDAVAFDLTAKDFSILARIKTKTDGTIWSLVEPGPRWTPNGQTFFIRGGKLAFDIGWVGAVSGKAKVADGEWHTVAITWQKSDERVRLYVDGKLDGEGELAAKDKLPKRAVRIGFTAPDFPRPATFFQGEMSEVRFYQMRLTEDLRGLPTVAAQDKSLVAHWQFGKEILTPGRDKTDNHHNAEVRRGLAPIYSRSAPLVARFSPHDTKAQWLVEDGRLRLRIPAGKNAVRFTVCLPTDVSQLNSTNVQSFATQLREQVILATEQDLSALTNGGPPRWPQSLETQAVLGKDDGPFATDVLAAPESNPWLAQMRFSGLDFFADGSLAVCTWDGDVWRVKEKSGGSNGVTKLAWQRIASGLYQPLGLKVIDGKVHVTCRDQLAVLHDLNGDGETDFYECLNNDHQVTEHFHEFAMGLQTDAVGNFYYAKSGCHGKAAIVPHHGTLLRVSKDGNKTEILATGFRAANGVCLNPDGSFYVTDQEGFWNPKNRINWVSVPTSGKPNFYGNMLGYHDVTDASDSAMVPPLCWITNTFDRSPAELLWVDSKRWGALDGALLNLSYGYGKVFLVPHERVGGQMQGGMIELPIPSFPTGVMRGRFHPRDRQLYLCGMFAWAGNATSPGGLYRLRATGEPMHMPVGLSATKRGLRLTFTESLDPKALSEKDLHVKTWSLKRTAGYGSKHYDEKELTVSSARLTDDGKTLWIDVADLSPSWCMEVKYSVTTAAGKPLHGVIHNTVHTLVD